MVSVAQFVRQLLQLADDRSWRDVRGILVTVSEKGRVDC
jgi:RecB family endonuclease NucS